MRNNIKQFLISNNYLKNLGFSLIYSRLNYAKANLEGTDSVTLNTLRLTQNHFARIVSNKQDMIRFLVLSNFKLTITIILFVFKALNVFLIKAKAVIAIGNTKKTRSMAKKYSL